MYFFKTNSKNKKKVTKMKTQILSRTCIKPTSPAPPHLQTYKLCALDQTFPAINVDITFFYSSNTETHDRNPIPDLIKSLSEALAIFHPFAGRVRDASTIDCNSEGAFFVEAKIDTQLSDLLDKPDYKLIDNLSPTSDPETMKQANGALLLIQFTSFSCGGIALCVSFAHRLSDLATMVTFLRSWTAIACNNCMPSVPDLSGATILPPLDDPPVVSLPLTSNRLVTKRFVFTAMKIADLKAKATAKGLQHQPSRVELVVALLWKCAIAANKEKSGCFRPSALFQAVNLRNRMTPPLPESIVGNFISAFTVLVLEEKELEINELVIKLRNGLHEFSNHQANTYRGEEGRSRVLQGVNQSQEFLKNLNAYFCSSWCRFPLYDTDFGWGKPVWHSSNVNEYLSNSIALADTRSGDGIKAMVTLDVEEMAMFERDVELLEFACVDPSAYV